MKKILYLPSWYPDRDNPIIGSFFREQALLAQQHYDVKVLAVQSRELKALRWLRAVLAAGGLSETVDGSDVLPPDCIRYRHLLPRKKYQSAFTWRWQLRLLQQHVAALQQQGWQPDVIHAHSLFGAGLFVEPLARACGAKSVLTEHDSFNLHRLPPFYQQRAIEALKRVDVLAGVSQHLANILSAHGAARRVHVCGNLVDETRFRLRDEPGETFSVLHVSYPDPVKGTELLFEAASLLDPDERAQFRFTIVSGSDRHQQIFRQMADARGVAAQFDIKACVARDDMPAEYTRHACYVSTSYSETFGVAIREAQQAGLPVVTTACGGIDRDVDDSNGVVVPTGDALALRDALRRVRNQRERYDPLQIRETCIARHGRDAFLRKLADLYH